MGERAIEQKCFYGAEIMDIKKAIQDAVEKKITVGEAVDHIMKVRSTFGVPLKDLLEGGSHYYLEKGRLWGKQVKVMITKDHVKTAMSLDDFLNALRTNIGSVAMIFRQKTFNKKIDEATKKVIKELDSAMIMHADKIEAGK